MSLEKEKAGLKTLNYQRLNATKETAGISI